MMMFHPSMKSKALGFNLIDCPFEVDHYQQDNPHCKKKSWISDETNPRGGTILLKDGLTDTIQSFLPLRSTDAQSPLSRDS